MDLDLSCSTLMAAAKQALQEQGAKPSTSFIKHLVPLLELGCTQLP